MFEWCVQSLRVFGSLSGGRFANPVAFVLWLAFVSAALMSCSSGSKDEPVAGSTAIQQSSGGAGATTSTGAVVASGGTIGGSIPTGGVVSTATGGTTSVATGGTTAAEPNTMCTIASTLTMSTAISTVGIVEWSTDLAGLDKAYIEFGLDQNYGMQAPVDLAEPNFRTLLLGMKPDHVYHYRVVAMAGSDVCTGDDNTLNTGSMPTDLGLLDLTINTPQPDKVAQGFIMAGFYMNGPAFIIDADGDYVWWFDSGNITRARMSYDGKSMWTQALNWTMIGFGGGAGVSPGGNPVIHHISMDGMDEQIYGLAEFGDPTHDFDVTPDGSYISPQFDADGCMTIVERTADGQLHDIIASSQVNPQAVSGCLVNSIHYWPSDDSITYSDLPHNTYVKMTRAGEVQWVLGGANSTFTQGDAITWHGEHGHQLISPTRFLMFNNGVNPWGGPTDGPTSIVYEVELDEATNTATRVWQYDGGLQTTVFGDAQRLPNGNTLVNYGTKNTFHEADPDSALVRSITWTGASIMYLEWRHSLYGPPDR